MKRLAILGASGHGKVVADTALQSGWTQVLFFDDAWPNVKFNGPHSVVGCSKALTNASNFDAAIIAIGDNTVRFLKTLDFLELGIELTTLIHPNTSVASDVIIDIGTVIFSGAVIQPGSRLEKSVIINTCASVDHDCHIGSGVHISPGAHLAGGVRIGKNSWIGIGASINQYLNIGSDVIVGAGSAVISDIQNDVTVVGVPAQVIKRIS